MIYEIGALTGEPDIDKINNLRAPILFGWRDYFELTNAEQSADMGGKQWVKPDQIQGIMRDQFAK